MAYHTYFVLLRPSVRPDPNLGSDTSTLRNLFSEVDMPGVTVVTSVLLLVWIRSYFLSCTFRDPETFLNCGSSKIIIVIDDTNDGDWDRPVVN